MYSPLAWLPVIELVGFFVIGGKIGFFLSLLWLMGATMLGFWLLKQGGLKALKRAGEQDNEFFAVEEAFDSLCLMIAALLLLMPGFISDFIAIPFVLAPVRHWLFGRTKANPDSFLHRFTKQSRGFREWTQKQGQGQDKKPPGASTVIEGEFTVVDDTERLPK